MYSIRLYFKANSVLLTQAIDEGEKKVLFFSDFARSAITRD